MGETGVRADACPPRRSFVRTRSASVACVACAVGGVVVTAGCDTPNTLVVLDNRYPAAAAAPLVVYRAAWQAVSFTDPVPPGMSSEPQSTVAASDNTAYVLLAPGWAPASSTTPASLVVLQSRGGFAVHLDQTLHIPVDDANFAGNCASGSLLSQAQADFVTGLVFPTDFAGLRYDAATCTTTPASDGARP
ncbi:MAG TPA: hypothetical protein VE987_21115 [Polyangiaceae bacterium]|nr:hypothetical protein [Polyangiaceae bacterium]